MLKIGILISGVLGLKSLLTLHRNNKIKLSCVFSDNNSKEILEYCINHNIKVFKGNPRNKRALNFVKNIGEIDLFFSINYLFIIEKELIEYPKLFSLNIHGSLLPKYRGRTPHIWAIINGEKKTGITVHKIDTGIDTGNILVQKEIEITNNATGGEILNKYSMIYPKLINEIISIIIDGKYVFTKQIENEATYFGKRIPNDGEINWDWSKERIMNWVRALADPYPGAFTYLNNEKMIINSILFSEHGYSYNMNNGTVLSTSPLIIKTPNGAIELLNYHFEKKNILEFKKGYILGK